MVLRCYCRHVNIGILGLNYPKIALRVELYSHHAVTERTIVLIVKRHYFIVLNFCHTGILSKTEEISVRLIGRHLNPEVAAKVVVFIRRSDIMPL